MPLPESDALVALLPHRPPFRFVDAVDAIAVAEHIEARWCVTGDEYFLKGHFPGTTADDDFDVFRLEPKLSANAFLASAIVILRWPGIAGMGANFNARKSMPNSFNVP